MKKIRLQTDQNNPAIQAYKEAIEQEKNNYHIFPKDNKWIVKKLDEVKTYNIFSTQQEATKYAKSLANQGTAIFIHGTDGRIEKRQDYSGHH